MLSSHDLLNDLRATHLNDPDMVTWSDDVLLKALNQSLYMLVLMRPDVMSKVVIIELQAGSRQFIPSDGIRLLRVVRNINADNSVGRAVRLVQQEDMDSLSPDWHTVDGLLVQEYMFDARSPKYFYVYPTVPVGSKLEIEYSACVTRVTQINMFEALPVAPIFSQPLQELMLYKLLSGDSTNGASGGEHLQVAMDLLGVKDVADERVSSARRTHI